MSNDISEKVFSEEKKAITALEIAHFFSEWTDDQAPLQERGAYLQASTHFLEKYDVREKKIG